MANINLNIADAHFPRVVDSICLVYSYSNTLPDGTPNPETKNQFAKRMLIVQVKSWVATVEGQVAQKTAFDSAIAGLDIT